MESGLPALADDAGLCVDAFGGLPGVDTAYYATRFGYPKGDDHNVSALLEHLAPGGELALDWDDEITAGACVTRTEAA